MGRSEGRVFPCAVPRLLGSERFYAEFKDQAKEHRFVLHADEAREAAVGRQGRFADRVTGPGEDQDRIRARR